MAEFKVKNGLLVDGNATVKSTVESTSTTTGALVVAGGAGFAGNVNAPGFFQSGDPVSTVPFVRESIALLRSQLEAPLGNVLYVSSNGDDANDGLSLSNTLANVHTALERAQPWTTVFVKSGDYKLYNQPVTIKQRVGLVGDNLRTTTIRPSQPDVDMFYVNNASYATGITFRDHISPSAVFSYNPDGSAGFISTSPYIQNCSSITTTGTGMRVDGNYVQGLRSMVCDSYTQTNAGGIGIHMLNRGYTQLVSVFTICCQISILAENGGFCSITNSNTSFGTFGLVSRGVSQPLYFGKLAEVIDTGDDILYVLTNLKTKPNYGDAVMFANYNQAKCFRDIGLIVDSLAIDLAYGSNTQSNFAGLQYWAQRESAIPNQATETLAAFKYAQQLATNVSANIEIVSPLQANVTQIFGETGGITVPIDEGFDLIANIISSGTLGITDRIIPNTFPPTSNVDITSTANLLISNKEFIQKEVIAYVNQEFPGFFANANNFIDPETAETKCERDAGFLIDSVYFDLLHGGNRQAVMAGVYYYNFNAEQSQIINQTVQTSAAYNFIGEIIDKIIRNKKIGAYDQEKCERDTGLIVDSLAFDLAYEGNSQSKFAGLQYWAQAESAIPNQSEETIAAINFARNLATNVSANIEIVSPYQSNILQIFGDAGSSSVAINDNFDLIIDIIQNGTVGVTDRIIPNGFPANTSPEVTNAANLIILNKDFIAAETIAFVNDTYPGFFANANNFVEPLTAETTCSRDVGFILDSVTFDVLHGGNRQSVMSGVYYYNFNANVTQINDQIVQTGQAYNFIGNVIVSVLTGTKFAAYNQDKCERDTGLIVDSLAFDLAYNSNTQSRFAGLQYWAQAESAIPNQSEETVAAINFARDLTANIILGEVIASPLQSNVSQVPTDASTQDEANVILDNFDLITDIIQNGTVGVTDRIIPNQYPSSVEQNIVNAANTITQNIDFIAAETIAFVNSTYPGFFANANNFIAPLTAEATCSRDVGFILESIRFDLLHGGNRQSITSGVYYYNFNANVTQINDQIVQTGQAYNFIGSLLEKVIIGETIANTYQTDVTQNTTASSAATESEVAYILNNISFINNIITNGPSIAGSKYPIEDTAVEDANVVNATKLILANRDFIKAETIAYINKELFDPPYQIKVKQNTTAAPFVTQAEANIVLENINFINNIITNGPSVAGAKYPIDLQVSSDANLINATKLILANRDFIKAETIAYINKEIFSPPYQDRIEQNTTAAPAATSNETNIILQDIQLITSIIENGPASAESKTSIQYTPVDDSNVINAAKIILANRDYIVAEVGEYINQNWANISNGTVRFYTVASSTPLQPNGTSVVRLLETLTDEDLLTNISVSFHQPSYISASGHTFEYVGSGNELATALPYAGGVPIQLNEVIQQGGGQVYFTSTDQQGDFRIGTELLFNRVDGTITGETFNKSLFAVMTPYILAIEG
jgi:hypothetical protein